MGAFLGCCVIAGVLYFWLKRIYNTLQLFLGTFTTTVNALATRAGNSPIITPMDVDDMAKSL